ncbi:MAG: cation-translocating P-type ATPase [Pirellulales bacterium]
MSNALNREISSCTPGQPPVSFAPRIWHSLSASEVAKALATDPRCGLSSQQAFTRQTQYGLNRLAEAPPVPIWKRFLGQFAELIVWILIVAAMVAGALGEWLDAFAIVAIVLLNGILGFLQEERAQRELASLRKRSAFSATAVRDRKQIVVAAEELVPGDLIELEAGDHIPADVRLIETVAFSVQESALTGESVPTNKDASVILPGRTMLADRSNMAYLGTIAVSGRAMAIVGATGMQTELGRIAGLLEHQPAEPTPLQKRLSELGRKLLVVCLGIVAIIFALQLVRGGELIDVFVTSVSLAVAAIPEGLPAVVTVVLAVGLRRMIRRNALIRKLPSVETLGCVTVICSDKTGTLTRNEMTVERLFAGEATFAVTGVGYSPRGDFILANEPIRPESHADLLDTLRAGVYCNRARLIAEDGGNVWQVLGDPTEGALLVAARKAGIPSELPGQTIHEIPFDAERKLMSVIVKTDEAAVMYVKGAPEAIIDKCICEQIGGRTRPLDPQRRQALLGQSAAMAAEALRVLALASKPAGDSYATEDESDLTFLGLVGMKDPPREEAREAVRRCYLAGIRPVMITGDHPATALAIARELGIAQPEDPIVSGNDLDNLSDEQLLQCVDGIRVFARVTAEHKLRIVSALRAHRQVVAMTGDGINDAAAVKMADIGIAMGITGTDVTKEAADMVLVDDNFASIVNAVEEGRAIFDNIQKFVHYLLSTNAGEVLLLFFAALVGWPLPLTAIQILWINLVTDGLPALALGMESPEPDIMRRSPRLADTPVISLSHAGLILLHGVLIAVAGIAAFLLVSSEANATIDHARTATFCTVAFAQLFFSIGCRSPRRTMPELGPFSNPYLLAAILASVVLQIGTVTVPGVRRIFGVDELPTWDWGLIFLIALAPVTIVEVTKLFRAWRFANFPHHQASE